jgi:hypothetical protein
VKHDASQVHTNPELSQQLKSETIISQFNQ